MNSKILTAWALILALLLGLTGCATEEKYEKIFDDVHKSSGSSLELSDKDFEELYADVSDNDSVINKYIESEIAAILQEDNETNQYLNSLVEDMDNLDMIDLMLESLLGENSALSDATKAAIRQLVAENRDDPDLYSKIMRLVELDGDDRKPDLMTETAMELSRLIVALEKIRVDYSPQEDRDDDDDDDDDDDNDDDGDDDDNDNDDDDDDDDKEHRAEVYAWCLGASYELKSLLAIETNLDGGRYLDCYTFSDGALLLDEDLEEYTAFLENLYPGDDYDKWMEGKLQKSGENMVKYMEYAGFTEADYAACLAGEPANEPESDEELIFWIANVPPVEFWAEGYEDRDTSVEDFYRGKVTLDVLYERPPEELEHIFAGVNLAELIGKVSQ